MLNMPKVDLKTLRNRLLMQREVFSQTPEGISCLDSITSHLSRALSTELAHLESIALYWPIREEIDLRDTLLTWASASPHRHLALPVTRADRHLDFYAWGNGDHLVPNQYGIPEPDLGHTNSKRIEPDCILIPCVGWLLDHSAHRPKQREHFWRLGYGGGFFDRTLAQVRQHKPTVLCIGVGFDWQALDPKEWQPAAHDEPLDAMLTESGLHHPQRN